MRHYKDKYISKWEQISIVSCTFLARPALPEIVCTIWGSFCSDERTQLRERLKPPDIVGVVGSVQFRTEGFKGGRYTWAPIMLEGASLSNP